ncbi:MAG TPA: Gfo/Idh/MocA family oxidoreductase [Gemmatimonadales bacterium]|jgi:predicted dehydrogenase
MSRLRVAVVGAGGWGRNHVRTLSGLPGVDLVAVCDVRQDRCEALRVQFPAVGVITSELGPALDAAEAVVIATPAASHADIALAAIDRGLPVLVEKPFALSVAEAARIGERAAASGVPVLVGHLLVFHPALQYLRDMVQGGGLGTVYYLYSQRVNLGQVRPDENALWSFGPHDVSVALELLSEIPESVAAQGRSYLQPGIEDVVFMTMTFRSGALAHVQMSWLDPHKERRLTVVGSQKMVVFDDMQPREKLKIYDKGVSRPPDYASYGESLAIREGDVIIPRVPNVEPLRAELEHFTRVARGEEPPRVTVEQGIAVVRILEAASRSMRADGAAEHIGGL